MQIPVMVHYPVMYGSGSDLVVGNSGVVDVRSNRILVLGMEWLKA